MATDVTHVDSDVFDSHSKQLIAAETLLPDLLVRLEVVNETIATEERNLQVQKTYGPIRSITDQALLIRVWLCWKS
jgi:hypothetical protein